MSAKKALEGVYGAARYEGSMPTTIPSHWKKVRSQIQFHTFRSWLAKLEVGQPIPANMSAEELRWSTQDVDLRTLPYRVTKPKRRRAA